MEINTEKCTIYSDVIESGLEINNDQIILTTFRDGDGDYW